MSSLETGALHSLGAGSEWNPILRCATGPAFGFPAHASLQHEQGGAAAGVAHPTPEHLCEQAGDIVPKCVFPGLL